MEYTPPAKMQCSLISRSLEMMNSMKSIVVFSSFLNGMKAKGILILNVGLNVIARVIRPFTFLNGLDSVHGIANYINRQLGSELAKEPTNKRYKKSNESPYENILQEKGCSSTNWAKIMM